jgi:hypothetical protein
MNEKAATNRILCVEMSFFGTVSPTPPGNGAGTFSGKI